MAETIEEAFQRNDAIGNEAAHDLATLEGVRSQDEFDELFPHGIPEGFRVICERFDIDFRELHAFLWGEARLKTDDDPEWQVFIAAMTAVKASAFCAGVRWEQKRHG